MKWEAVVAAARTGSLFASRRAVVVRRADLIRVRGRTTKARRPPSRAAQGQAEDRGRPRPALPRRPRSGRRRSCCSPRSPTGAATRGSACRPRARSTRRTPKKGAALRAHVDAGAAAARPAARPRRGRRADRRGRAGPAPPDGRGRQARGLGRRAQRRSSADDVARRARAAGWDGRSTCWPTRSAARDLRGQPRAARGAARRRGGGAADPRDAAPLAAAGARGARRCARRACRGRRSARGCCPRTCSSSSTRCSTRRGAGATQTCGARSRRSSGPTGGMKRGADAATALVAAVVEACGDGGGAGLLRRGEGVDLARRAGSCTARRRCRARRPSWRPCRSRPRSPGGASSRPRRRPSAMAARSFFTWVLSWETFFRLRARRLTPCRICFWADA